jgi:6-phosphofructokinase
MRHPVTSLQQHGLLNCCSCAACVQIDKCFGFDTAVEEAQRALLAAKVEAVSGYKGLGLVKLMGRSSGFIAMQASMASGEHSSLPVKQAGQSRS